LATVESHSTPLPDATTSSLDALKAYATAMKVTVATNDPGAGIVLLRRAVEIDPQFAIAYGNMGFSYSNIDASLSTQYVTKPWPLRERASERERFFIEVIYPRQVTGNLEKAYETLELWLQAYPRAHEPPSPIDLLGGLSTQGTGRYERAIEASRKLIAT